MIRVLNMINLDCGGAETTVMNFYRNIDRSRVQFDFLVTDDGREHYYEAEAISLGARVFPRPMRTRHPIRNTLVLYKILKENPDIRIIHIHNYLSFVAVDTLLTMFLGVPVRIAHSRSAIPRASVIHRFFQPLLRATATHWFACSTEAGISLFGKDAPNHRKFVFYPNARDIEQLRLNTKNRNNVRQALKLGSKAVLLHIGRLNVAKNQFFLLEACSAAIRINPDLVLLIAGDGELREELENAAAKLGLGSTVRFLGFRDDIPDLLHAADMFVLPSLFEGLPGGAIEAQAAGLPCLLSNTITRETKVTNNVEFLPIDKGTSVWAERMANCHTYSRNDAIDDVRRAGYDIVDAAKRLTEFYIKLATKKV